MVLYITAKQRAGKKSHKLLCRDTENRKGFIVAQPDQCKAVQLRAGLPPVALTSVITIGHLRPVAAPVPVSIGADTLVLELIKLLPFPLAGGVGAGTSLPVTCRLIIVVLSPLR